MAAHTPAPWAMGSRSGHNGCNVYAGDDAIASVYGLPMNHTVKDIAALSGKWEEGFANARLIAAAPDLLAALSALADLRGWFDRPPISATGIQAMNAIAKAEGRL